MKTITLTQGQVALVDEADFDWLSQWNWHALWNNRAQNYRAVRNTDCGKHGLIYMSRFILGLSGRARADHINRNTLDNQRHNLRPATHAQNCWNRGLQNNSRSGFKGVSFHGRLQRWQVRVQSSGMARHIGYFDTAEIAAKAYDAAARKYHGEFAFQNFPGAA